MSIFSTIGSMAKNLASNVTDVLDGDILDKVNSFVDDVTGQDWLGDLVATGLAVSTQQWDEVGQHGLDLVEDGFKAAGWDKGAKYAKIASDAVDMASDLYHGRHEEASAVAGKLTNDLKLEFQDSPKLEDTTQPSSDDITKSTGYWTTTLRTGDTRGYMRALMLNDPSARAAIKDDGFKMLLTQAVKENNQLVELITNLTNAQHSTAKAGLRAIQV